MTMPKPLLFIPTREVSTPLENPMNRLLAISQVLGMIHTMQKL
jgi:hypothetical protein